MAMPTPRELLNTSWTLHRLSPLHHGKEFDTLLNNPIALKTYARRLHDHITGDVLGGIYVGATAAADDDSLSKTGALKACTWETIPGWSYLDESNGNSRLQSAPGLGILIVFQYEFVIYKAALLAPPAPEGSERSTRRRERLDASSSSASTYLPLLLTRLPTTLKQTFISFLSANFDNYCSLLRFPPSFLCIGLETYLNVLVSANPTVSRSILDDVVKEVHLTLHFSTSIAPALRTLNISVLRETLTQFIHDQHSEPSDDGGNPFLRRLNAYLEKHLALNLQLEDLSDNRSLAKQYVLLSKVACGAFVLGTEGKLKLVLTSPDTGDASPPRIGDIERITLQASEKLLNAAISKAIASES